MHFCRSVHVQLSSEGWKQSVILPLLGDTHLSECLLDRCLWISLTQVYTPLMGSMRIWSPLCSVHAGRELKSSLFLSQRHTWSQLRSWFFTFFVGNHSISTKGLRLTFHLLQSYLPSMRTLPSISTTCSVCWTTEAACDQPSQGFLSLVLRFLQHHCQHISSPGHKACLCWAGCWADASAEALVSLPLRVLNL